MLCKECGVGRIQEDLHGSETTLVCDNCGYISSEAPSSSVRCDASWGAFPVSLENKYHIHLDRPSNLKKRMKYYSLIDQCVEHCLKKDHSVKEAAKELYDEIVSLWFQKSDDTKKLYAAVCCYVAMREIRQAVAVEDVCKNIGVLLHNFQKYLDAVLKLTNRSLPQLGLDGIAWTLQTLPCMQNRENLIEKALTIVGFLRRFSLIDGRKTATQARICAYLALVSEEKEKRRCTSVKKFVRINRLSIDLAPLTELVHVFRERLVVLVERLPWKTGITKQTYHKFIDDAMRHQNVLFNYVSESETNKYNGIHEIMTPPVWLRPKKKKDVRNTDYPTASTSETLSDADLSESELDEYLRTPDEVVNARKIHDLLQKNDVV